MNFCTLLVHALGSHRIALDDKMGYILGNAL